MTEAVKCKSIYELINALAKLEQEYETFLPVRNDGVTSFACLRDLEQGKEEEINGLIFQNQPVLYPIKNFILPATETYLSFRREADQVEFMSIDEGVKPQVIFGAKPCDLRGLSLLDHVFLAVPVD